MLEWLANPQLEKADLIVFPECIWSPVIASRVFDEAWPIAQTVPGPATQAIEQWGRRSMRSVVFGLLEQGQDGKLFNTAVLIGPNGLVAATERSICLTWESIDSHPRECTLYGLFIKRHSSWNAYLLRRFVSRIIPHPCTRRCRHLGPPNQLASWS